MSFIQSIIYGFVSGLTEFLPVSSGGHQTLLRELFGISQGAPVLDVLIHIAIILAIIYNCRAYLRRLLLVSRSTAKTRALRNDRSNIYDYRLIVSSALSMVFVMLILFFVGHFGDELVYVALFALINGVILYVSAHMPQGNKESRHMSMFDSAFIGLFGAFSVLPGISRVGASLSGAVWRGADKQKAINWVLVLSIPAMLMLLLFDFIAIITGGIGALSFLILFGYLFAFAFAFAGASLGIYILRYFVMHATLSSFAYYSWGVALLSFILYLSA